MNVVTFCFGGKTKCKSLSYPCRDLWLMYLMALFIYNEAAIVSPYLQHRAQLQVERKKDKYC